MSREENSRETLNEVVQIKKVDKDREKNDNNNNNEEEDYIDLLEEFNLTDSNNNNNDEYQPKIFKNTIDNRAKHDNLKVIVDRVDKEAEMKLENLASIMELSNPNENIQESNKSDDKIGKTTSKKTLRSSGSSGNLNPIGHRDVTLSDEDVDLGETMKRLSMSNGINRAMTRGGGNRDDGNGAQSFRNMKEYCAICKGIINRFPDLSENNKNCTPAINLGCGHLFHLRCYDAACGFYGGRMCTVCYRTKRFDRLIIAKKMSPQGNKTAGADCDSLLSSIASEAFDINDSLAKRYKELKQTVDTSSDLMQGNYINPDLNSNSTLVSRALNSSMSNTSTYNKVIQVFADNRQELRQTPSNLKYNILVRNKIDVQDIYDADIGYDYFVKYRFSLRDLHSLGFSYWGDIVYLGVNPDYFSQIFTDISGRERRILSVDDLVEFYYHSYVTIIQFIACYRAGHGSPSREYYKRAVKEFCSIEFSDKELKLLEFDDINLLLNFGPLRDNGKGVLDGNDYIHLCRGYFGCNPELDQIKNTMFSFYGHKNRGDYLRGKIGFNREHARILGWNWNEFESDFPYDELNAHYKHKKQLGDRDRKVVRKINNSWKGRGGGSKKGRNNKNKYTSTAAANRKRKGSISRGGKGKGNKGNYRSSPGSGSNRRAKTVTIMKRKNNNNNGGNSLVSSKKTKPKFDAKKGFIGNLVSTSLSSSKKEKSVDNIDNNSSSRSSNNGLRNNTQRTKVNVNTNNPKNNTSGSSSVKEIKHQEKDSEDNNSVDSLGFDLNELI